MTKTSNPKDPGSLNVGTNPLNLQKGDKVTIKGDPKSPRTISYVMGSVAKSNVHLCFKGSGPVPLGAEIEYEKFEETKAEVKVA
jgi:hypothetical protein